MNTFMHYTNAYLLLRLIYHRERTSIHSANIAFFGLTDYQECQFFLKKLDINRAELIVLVELLFESGLIRFNQFHNTLFVFLTAKACRLVQKQHILDQLFLMRVEENVDNEKKNETN